MSLTVCIRTPVACVLRIDFPRIQRDKLREAEMEKVGISYGAGAFVSDCVCLRASLLA